MATIYRPALVRQSLVVGTRGLPCGTTTLYYSLRPQIYSRLSSQARFQSVVPEPSAAAASIPPSSSTSTAGPTTSSSPSQAEPPLPRSRTRRFVSATALFLLFGTLGFGMAAAPALDTLNGVLAPPTDAETLTLFRPASPKAQEINEHIMHCTLADLMRQKPEFTESRPHLKIPETMRSHNLTGGTLLGDDKIAVPPLSFLDDNETAPALVQISYLGQDLCGHPGLIHGGLLATLLDEGLARACFPALPNKVGVTASLTINYRKPCPSDAYVVLRAQTTKSEGRKAWVKGHIELMTEDGSPGEVVADAEALFIEPRGAKNMARIYSPSK